MAVVPGSRARDRGVVQELAIPAGAVGLNMGVVNYHDISSKRYEYDCYPHATVGTGLYLVVAGGALGLLVGLVSLVPRSLLLRHRDHR